MQTAHQHPEEDTMKRYQTTTTAAPALHTETKPLTDVADGTRIRYTTPRGTRIVGTLRTRCGLTRLINATDTIVIPDTATVEVYA